MDSKALQCKALEAKMFNRSAILMTRAHPHVGPRAFISSLWRWVFHRDVSRKRKRVEPPPVENHRPEARATSDDELDLKGSWLEL